MTITSNISCLQKKDGTCTSIIINISGGLKGPHLTAAENHMRYLVTQLANNTIVNEIIINYQGNLPLGSYIIEILQNNRNITSLNTKANITTIQGTACRGEINKLLEQNKNLLSYQIINLIQLNNLPSLQKLLYKRRLDFKLNENEENLSHLAARYQQLAILKWLTEISSAQQDDYLYVKDIDATDNKGNTALYLAAQTGFLDGVHYLLSQNATIKKNNDGKYPVGLGLAANHVLIAEQVSLPKLNRSNSLITHAKALDNNSSASNIEGLAYLTTKPSEKSPENQRTKEMMNNIFYKINNLYEYEDQDIYAILGARLDQYNSRIGSVPVYSMAPVDTISHNQLTQRLIDDINNHPQGKRIILIPCNIGNYHWVGLLLEFEQLNVCRRAEFLDSLNMNIPQTLQDQLHLVHQIYFTKPQNLITQIDGTSCGPCTIENLILRISNSEPNVDMKMHELRRTHLNALRTGRKDFFESFNQRQRLNQRTFDSTKYLPTSPYKSKSEILAIVDIASDIRGIQEKNFFIKIMACFDSVKDNRKEPKDVLDEFRDALWKFRNYPESEKIMVRFFGVQNMKAFDTIEEYKKFTNLQFEYNYLESIQELLNSPDKIEKIKKDQKDIKQQSKVPVQIDGRHSSDLSISNQSSQKISRQHSEKQLINNQKEDYLKNERRNLTFDRLSQIENLIFQGGGVKGIAYLGAMQVLCDETAKSHIKLSQIKRVGGASAGAITALLIALGYNYQELESILKNLDLKNQLLDDIKVNAHVFKFILLAKKVPKNERFENKDEIFFFLAYFCLNLTIRLLIDKLENEGRNLIDNEFKKYSTKLLYNILKVINKKTSRYEILNEYQIEIREIFEIVLPYFLKILYFLSTAAFSWIDEKLGFRLSKYLDVVETKIDDFVQAVKEQLAFKIFEKIKIEQFEEIEKFLMQLKEGETNTYLFRNKEELNDFHQGMHIILNLILKDQGIFSGEVFKSWLKDRIAHKAGSRDITFRQLNETRRCKELYIVVTNLSNGLTTIFSHENTPDVIVADAVRASMSIPYFFTPPLIHTENGIYKEEYGAHGNGNFYTPLYADGGVLDNYPIWLFDHIRYFPEKDRLAHSHKHHRNYYTLGLRLVSKEAKMLFEDKEKAQPTVNYDNKDFFNYSWALVGTMLNHKQENDHYHNRDRHRTIYIDYLDVSTLDFDLNEDQKKRLQISARYGTVDYLKRLDKKQPLPTSENSLAIPSSNSINVISSTPPSRVLIPRLPVKAKSATTNRLPQQPISLFKTSRLNINNQQQKQNEQELIKAAKEGNIDKIKECIRNRADINVRDPASYSETPLYHSISSGCFKVVECLLAAGADFHLANTKGHTPLHRAGTVGTKEMVDLLLSKGMDINILDKEGHTPLHWSVFGGNKTSLEAFLQKGADFTIKDSWGKTPSDYARERGRYDLDTLIKNHQRQTSSLKINYYPSL